MTKLFTQLVCVAFIYLVSFEAQAQTDTVKASKPIEVIGTSHDKNRDGCIINLPSQDVNLLLELKQDKYPGNEIGMMPKKDPGGLKNLQISGFYRFYGTYQRQIDPYLLNAVINDTARGRNIFIGDDSQLPNLLINVSGKPSDKTSWGFDIMMFQFLNGIVGTTYGKQIPDSLRPDVQNPLLGTRLGGNLGLNLGLNLNGKFKTKYGNLSVNAGGIQWVSISDLTMASFRGYNRFMLYERNPWDPTGLALSSRYDQYFQQGSIDQDTRWGNRAFFGLVLQGAEMPGRISFLLMAGKTELNGGFDPYPNYSYGGKIKKSFGSKNFVSINSINSSAATDSLTTEYFGFNVITTEFNLEHKGFAFKGEVGGGTYYSPEHNAGWGELMQFKLSTPLKSKWPQVELHYYRISPNVVNNNAIYWNTSVAEYRVNNIPAGSIGSSALLIPTGSSMVRLGQMTNNRQGLNLNLQKSTKHFSFSGGMGFASELTPAAAAITYTNPVNNVTRSRFWRWTFPQGVGPYQRYNSIYRDVYQAVNLSDDSSGVVVNEKHFNMMEAQIKYKGKLFGKELFVFSMLQANSASRDWSPITVFNEDAYVRQYVSEVEAYWAIRPGVLINTYFGYERTLGNYLTDINNETFRPRNQTGRGIGAGMDIDLGKNTRLYFRHRWYSFEDKSFELDQFNGRELTVELKAFF
jgi:hypothetical protein